MAWRITTTHTVCSQGMCEELVKMKCKHCNFETEELYKVSDCQGFHCDDCVFAGYGSIDNRANDWWECGISRLPKRGIIYNFLADCKFKFSRNS